MEEDNLIDFDGDILQLDQSSKNVSGRLSDISNNPFDTVYKRIVKNEVSIECISETDQLKNKRILVGKENINVGQLVSPLQTPVKSIKNKKISTLPLYLDGKETTADISNKSNNLLSMKNKDYLSNTNEELNVSCASLGLLDNSLLNKTFDDVASLNVPLPESPKEGNKIKIQSRAIPSVIVSCENNNKHIFYSKTSTDHSNNISPVSSSKNTNDFEVATFNDIKLSSSKNIEYVSSNQITMSAQKSKIKIFEKKELNCSFGGFSHENRKETSEKEDLIQMDAMCLSYIFSSFKENVDEMYRELDISATTPPWDEIDENSYQLNTEDPKENVGNKKPESETNNNEQLNNLVQKKSNNQYEKFKQHLQLGKKIVRSKSDSKISDRKSIRTEAANVDLPKIKKQTNPLAVKLDKNLKVKNEKDKIKNKGPMKAVLPLQNMAKTNATKENLTPSKMQIRHLKKMNSPNDPKLNCPIAQSTPDMSSKKMSEANGSRIKRSFSFQSSANSSNANISNISLNKSLSPKTSLSMSNVNNISINSNKSPKPHSSIPTSLRTLSRRKSANDIKAPPSRNNSFDHEKKTPITIKRSTSFQCKTAPSSSSTASSTKSNENTNVKKYGISGLILKPLRLVPRTKKNTSLEHEV